MCVIFREIETVCIFDFERERENVCVCVEPLLFSTQCACAILSSAACPTLQSFSTLSHKRYDFRKKLPKTKKCSCLIFSTAFV